MSGSVRRWKGRLGSALGTLFGLVFVVAGLGVGVYFAGGLLDWLDARDWAPVEARLTGVDLVRNSDSDGGTTWRATAEYFYEWQGRQYSGDRVGLHGGADNIGDYHRRIHDRLARALRSGEAVTAWVDPDDPARAVLDRDPRWGLMAFGMMFPLVFGGAGLGVIWAVRRGRRQAVERDRQREMSPDRPWLWHERWRSPELRSRASSTMWFAVVFATFWNLISLPAAFLIPGEVADGNTAALIGLLFPVVGVVLAVWAVREVIRRRRYGESVLRLDGLPVPLGGRLGAVLEVPARLQDRDVEVHLACVHRYRTGSGKNRSTREETLWDDQARFMATSGGAPGTTGARIEMRLPADQPVAREEPADDRIVWRLTVTSEEPGVDYKASFELPVFETARSHAEDDPEPVALGPVEDADWQETGVLHGYAGGGQRFAFPRFRMLGSGLMVLAFALVFGGAGVGLILAADEVLIGGVFAGVGALIGWGAVSMIFQRSEIVVGLQRIRWRHGVFGGWQEIDAGLVESIEAEKSGSVGNRRYFRLRLKRVGEDHPSTIIDWIPGRRGADALARKISGLAGVRGDSQRDDGPGATAV